MSGFTMIHVFLAALGGGVLGGLTVVGVIMLAMKYFADVTEKVDQELYDG